MSKDTVAINKLLNIVLCSNRDQAIAEARDYLVDIGLLNEAGEPTPKAWAMQSSRAKPDVPR